MSLALFAIAGLFVVIGIIAWFEGMSAETKWNLAAEVMKLEGYTELEIIQELGPRPKT